MAKSIDAFSKALAPHGLALEEVGEGRRLDEAAGWAGELPTHAVKPATPEQLAGVLGAAKASKVDLWIAWNASGSALVTQPRGTAPVVLLDLSRFDKILAVDEASGFALVEPGVSHAQLAEHLQKKGLKFWLDAGLDAEASIAGGIWQRRFGYTAYGDTLMMQCGMEVMLADGSLVRTGMGAMPGENSWQLFKYGFGPYADGTFTQTASAVITKMGFWISPQPPAYRPFAWRVEDDATLAKLMEIVRDLRINMVVPNTLVAVDGASDAALVGAEGSASWNVYGALYGLPKNVDVVWSMLGGVTAQLGSAKLEALDPNHPRALLMSGTTPVAAQKSNAAAKPRTLQLVFALPIEGDAAVDFAHATQKAASGSGCTVIVEQGTSWRALLAQVSIRFEKDAADKALALGSQLITQWAGKGIGVVQASPALYGKAMATYSDPGYTQLRRRIAAALA